MGNEIFITFILCLLTSQLSTPTPSSGRKAVYNPKTFILHAVSLHQAFAHCGIFSTAATRRCTARVSVPSSGNALSGPLPVVALVSRYLTNKLIGPRPIPKRLATLPILSKKDGDMENYPTFRLAMLHFGVRNQGVTDSFATIRFRTSDTRYQISTVFDSLNQRI